MAIDPVVIAGIAYLSLDGVQYQLVSAAKYQVSGIAYETQMGMDGYHGQSGKQIPGIIGGTLRDRGDLSIAKIKAMKNVTAVLELANGKMVTGRNMCIQGVVEVDAQEGTFAVEFQGPSVEEA